MSVGPGNAGGGGSIGKYQIVEPIGSGGFATVFKAWDPVIKRAVAIKMCKVGSELHARFFQEAELAGRLQHPNITTIYECGVEDDVPYIVQELLSGEDLSALIARREAIPLAEKIRILVGVALGLEYAHHAGVIHRDIKPANIRLLESGAVKIMDFGIAKAIGAPSGLTGPGVTVGSSSYMSPEQVSGDPVDFRTDIFSFGVGRLRALQLSAGVPRRQPLSAAGDDRQGGRRVPGAGRTRSASGAGVSGRARDAEGSGGPLRLDEGAARSADGGSPRIRGPRCPQPSRPCGTDPGRRSHAAADTADGERSFRTSRAWLRSFATRPWH